MNDGWSSAVRVDARKRGRESKRGRAERVPFRLDAPTRSPPSFISRAFSVGREDIRIRVGAAG